MQAKVLNPKNGSLCFEASFQVDPVAEFSFIPGQKLIEIDIHPLQVGGIFLPNGRHQFHLMGECCFDGEGLYDFRICPVIFAPANAPCSLGRTAFEDLSVRLLMPKLAAPTSAAAQRNLTKGENVRIIGGPFATFKGVVRQVQSNQPRLTVDLTISGRSVSVEMYCWDVERIPE